MSADPTSTGRRGLLCAGAGAALALAGCAAGQPASAPRRADTALPPLDGAPAFAMPGTRQIDWAANGHVHRIFVAEPIAPPPAQGYPVIFVLDGNILFPIVAQLVRNRGARSDMAARFPAVVVGLGYATPGVLDTTARAYDYTPPLQGDDAGTRMRRWWIRSGAARAVPTPSSTCSTGASAPGSPGAFRSTRGGRPCSAIRTAACWRCMRSSPALPCSRATAPPARRCGGAAGR